MKTTNAMRILDKLSVTYDVYEYDFDDNNLDAMHVSSSLGFLPEQVFKTIVLINDEKKLFVFVLPADFSISLKKARTLTKSGQIDLLKTSDLQKHTGYIRGGCSPLGMIKKYPTFIEETVLLEDFVCVSAGVRGEMIRLSPADLIKATDGIVCDFV